MATPLSKSWTYDAPLERVRAMLLTPAFREEVCEAQGVLRQQVSIDGQSVRIEQVQAAQGLPGFATKLVGDEVELVQSEDWWAGDRADVAIEIPGKPGEIAGTATLTEDGQTTTETVELTVRADVPLVGGKVEQLVVDMIEKAMQQESQVGARWLTDQRT